MNKLTTAQLAYIAGLFDGEGCVGAFFTKRDSGATRIICRCSLAMTSEETVQWLLETTGIGRISFTAAKPERNWKAKYTWYLNENESYDLLRAIRQYTITKFSPIGYAIELLQLKSWNTNRMKNNNLRQHELVYLIQECNHRGTVL